MIEISRRGAIAAGLASGAALTPIGRAAAQQAAAGTKIFPYPTTTRDLANGLRVIVIETGFPDIVSLQIPVSVGSRNEVEPGKSGFAHFFEHMMFRGTKAYPSEKYNATLKFMGADSNAFTSDDLTCYHMNINKEDLETALKIEGDRFQNLEYSEPDFRTESLAVYGEYNKNSSNPTQKLFETQRANAFKVHTYRHTTMGFLDDIKAMPEQFAYSRQFFDRYYRPERTTVIVAGDVKPEPVFALVDKYFGAWKKGAATPPAPTPEPPPAGPLYVHVPWASETSPWMTVAFRGPAAWPTASNPDAGDQQALDVLWAYAFSESSPLYQRLVVKEQKAQTLGVSAGDRVDPAMLTVMARLRDKADMAYVRAAIQDELASLRETLPDPKRIADIRSNLKYGFASQLDSTAAIAEAVVYAVGATRDIETINAVYRRYDTVTPEDVRRVARKYFTDRNMVVTTLSFGAPPAEAQRTGSVETVRQAAVPAAQGAAAQAPAQAPARGAGPAGKGAFRELIDPAASPLIDVAFRFRTGAIDDPAGKAGLAELTAAMVTEAGSKALTYEQVQTALFPMAAGFGAQVDKEVTTFAGTVHRDNLARWYDVVAGQLLEPGFREEDFTRVRSDLVTNIRVSLRGNNDEELGNEVLYEQLYAGHPYGRLNRGHAAEVEKLTLADVRDFHRTHYTQGALTFAVAGAAGEAFLTKARADLAQHLPAAALGRKQIPPAKPPQGLAVTLVQKDVRAAAISMGFPIDVQRGHPDFVALYLARSYLGEHRNSSSHLYQRMREIRGMNYGDYAYTEYFPAGMFRSSPAPGVPRTRQAFRIWIRPVPIEQTHFAIRIAKYELDKLVREGISEEDFVATKNFLTKQAGLLTARQSDRLGYALDESFYGAPEFVRYVRSGLATLTRAQVNAAMKKHLASPNMAIVVVTPEAEALKAALVANAPSPMKYASEKPAAILAEDKTIERYPLAIKAESVRIVAVGQVFEGPLFG